MMVNKNVTVRREYRVTREELARVLGIKGKITSVSDNQYRYPGVDSKQPEFRIRINTEGD